MRVHALWRPFFQYQRNQPSLSWRVWRSSHFALNKIRSIHRLCRPESYLFMIQRNTISDWSVQQSFDSIWRVHPLLGKGTYLHTTVVKVTCPVKRDLADTCLCTNLSNLLPYQQSGLLHAITPACQQVFFVLTDTSVRSPRIYIFNSSTGLLQRQYCQLQQLLDTLISQTPNTMPASIFL